MASSDTAVFQCRSTHFLIFTELENVMYELTQTTNTAWKYRINAAEKNNHKVLFLGCSHIDAACCARDKLKSVLDMAVACGARIVFNGDTNDLMQGRNDPRRSYKELKAEWTSKTTKPTSYINDVIEETVEFLKPYAQNIDIMGLGNHETAAIKNLDVDATSLIAYMLQKEVDHEIYVGGLEGFLRVLFYWQPAGQRKMGTSASRTIMFKHDSGSLGKRTKGALAFDIMQGDYPNADIFVTAHTHDMLAHETKATILNQNGKYEYPERIFLQGPSFEESWADPGKRSWWTLTNKGPRAIGGWLLSFDAAIEKSRINIKTRYSFEK